MLQQCQAPCSTPGVVALPPDLPLLLLSLASWAAECGSVFVFIGSMLVSCEVWHGGDGA